MVRECGFVFAEHFPFFFEAVPGAGAAIGVGVVDQVVGLEAADGGHGTENGIRSVRAVDAPLFHVALAFHGEFALGVSDAFAVQDLDAISVVARRCWRD